jgi:putative endonuclease
MIINMKTKKAPINKAWIVYVLRCRNDTLYTGITNNIEKRLIAHNRGMAAKYTRSRRPVVLSAVSNSMSKTEALRLEMKIKKLAKGKKISTLKMYAKKRGKNIS